MRNHLPTLLKIAFTVAGIAFVLARIDLASLGDILLNADPGWLLLTLLLVILSLVVRAYRWLLLLRGLGVAISFGRLVALYFVGSFFNSFLPTSFGGDVMRVVEVARDVPVDVAAGTVIVDRLTGLLMLFIMALLALPFRPAGFPDELLTLVVTVAVVGLGIGVLLLEGRLVRRFSSWLPSPLSPVGDGPVARTLQAVSAVGPRSLMGAFAVSIVFNLILTVWWWSAGRALGFAIPFTYFLLVIPFLSISLLIPSIGGLGPREVLASELFSPAVLAPVGVVIPLGAGVAISLLVFLLQRLSGLPGGPLYLWMSLRGATFPTDKEANHV